MLSPFMTIDFGLTGAQHRALLHLFVGAQYDKRTGRRWYPSRGTYGALQRKGLVTKQRGAFVLTADGVATARGCIPY